MHTIYIDDRINIVNYLDLKSSHCNSILLP